MVEAKYFQNCEKMQGLNNVHEDQCHNVYSEKKKTYIWN